MMFAYSNKKNILHKDIFLPVFASYFYLKVYDLFVDVVKIENTLQIRYFL